jgi:uncharacterized membrane protein YphA (DoxX/SURF4 family)
MKRETIAYFFLRGAIASVFIYAAIASFFDPDNWIEFFPLFLQQAVPEHILISFFSIYEIILASWLLSGKFTFYAAVLSILTISGIIIFNLSVLDVVFRDFAIVLSAVSLAVFTYKKK